MPFSYLYLAVKIGGLNCLLSLPYEHLVTKVERMSEEIFDMTETVIYLYEVLWSNPSNTCWWWIWEGLSHPFWGMSSNQIQHVPHAPKIVKEPLNFKAIWQKVLLLSSIIYSKRIRRVPWVRKWNWWVVCWFETTFIDFPKMQPARIREETWHSSQLNLDGNEINIS